MSTQTTFDAKAVIAAIAQELQVSERQVQAAVTLLDEGNTIPFVARYRKEATGGLDEKQLRAVEDLYSRARELEDRRQVILKSIDDQGLLTDALRRQILACDNRPLLEDLYAPFKPKRRTRGMAAREKGLQPLADILLQQRSLTGSAEQLLRTFVSPDKDVPDSAAALAGACDIVAETWAEEPELRQWMVEQADRGQIKSVLKRGQQDNADRFESYVDHSERVQRLPSYRFLAMKRGEAEGVLRLSVEPDEDYVLPKLQRRLIRNASFEFASQLKDTIDDCYKRLLRPAAESTVMQRLKARADEEAITVFARNLRELLLAAPAGPLVTIGIDPGFRTGCKVAVVDQTGKYVQSTTIFPTAPRNDIYGSTTALLDLIRRHDVRLIAIGNGTASRETDAFVSKLLRDHQLSVTKVVVSEAGASVYSASELAGEEYPDLDLTVRGAISIAHRLQDPLAELVKIDPQAIGVGQYQHDVNQTLLKKALDREVESCVNSVGVDVNMASAPLLSHVAGIGPGLAKNIVEYRNSAGAFQNRRQLLKVPKLGPKAFEQAAGFLRIRSGSEPLDNSGVHPESYAIVGRMAAHLSTTPDSLVGQPNLVSRLRVEDFVTDHAGEFTVRDILSELASPGRDPRSEFKVATFAENVQSMSDLTVGMKLEGVVTNVTNFGAFVDIGVHQDGLIHISQLADHFVKDPTLEVKVGDIVKVTVLDVDESRKRISLSRKSQI
ncbi:MAG: Tex family protein [Planctomycetaceae bacterium]